MYGKLTDRALFSVTAVPHIAQHFAGFYCFPFFHPRCIFREMGIIKVTALFTADSDPPSAHMLNRPGCGRKYRIKPSLICRRHQIRPLMSPFAAVGAFFHPGILIRYPAFHWKADKIIPYRTERIFQHLILFRAITVHPLRRLLQLIDRRHFLWKRRLSTRKSKCQQFSFRKSALFLKFCCFFLQAAACLHRTEMFHFNDSVMQSIFSLFMMEYRHSDKKNKHCKEQKTDPFSDCIIRPLFLHPKLPSQMLSYFYMHMFLD